MVEKSGFLGGYYRNTFETLGESEDSGSSGRTDPDVTASEHSCVPTKKRIIVNSNELGAFGVPKQVISSSNLSRSERKDLIRKLSQQVEQIHILLRKAELLRTNGVTVSSSNDILSCSDGNASRHDSFHKSAVLNAGSGKTIHPQSNASRGSNRGSSGRFESAKQAPLDTANVMLMKQCETLLKRLMSHQYAWVFNTPVDVVKLNIPDYFNVIKHPMDLGTVRSKINSGIYSSPLEFAADVRLTFTNAMTYNPPGNDVHLMADTLNKFFEVRWKSIEKKLPVNEIQVPAKSDTFVERESVKSMPPAKKRKITIASESVIEPAKRVLTEEERHNLGRQLESVIEELPAHIIDFLKKQTSKAGEDEIEIEIDIDDLSDDTLVTLRQLLDDFLQEKQKKQSAAEPCEIELRNGSGPSNSSIQHCEGNELADEDVAVGENEPPVAESSSDSDSSTSERESDGVKTMNQEDVSKLPEPLDSEVQMDERTDADERLQDIHSFNGSDQFENPSHEKRSFPEADHAQDGNGAQLERQASSEKLYRAALLKNRFADIILKAREKALPQVQNDKGDPEKLRREREELELQKKKEKARLQAEAQAAEDARRRAEEEAAAEAKRKRELEREAARQALLKMEKTVEINENSRFLEDLEMLSSAPADHLTSSAEETSPEHSLDALGSFKFRGSNPLEQLGLYMKRDEEEEEPEPPKVSNPVNDVEEGEID